MFVAFLAKVQYQPKKVIFSTVYFRHYITSRCPSDQSLITLKIAVNKAPNLELILFFEGHTILSFSHPLLNSVRNKILLLVSLCAG